MTEWGSEMTGGSRRGLGWNVSGYPPRISFQKRSRQAVTTRITGIKNPEHVRVFKDALPA